MPEKNVLVIIFKSYPDVWQDTRRFKALLSDLLPNDKLKKNLLSICVDENIPLEMSRQKSVSSIEVHRWSQRLVNSCGCIESLAKEIIGLWLEAFNLNNNSPILVENASVKELNLSKRVFNCLKDVGIININDLSTMTPDQLLSIRGLGQKSLHEIEEALQEHGLKLENISRGNNSVKREKVNNFSSSVVKVIPFPGNDTAKRERVNNFNNVDAKDFIVENRTLIRYMGSCRGETYRQGWKK